MRDVRIIFQKTKGFVPWVIRKVTRSEINHVAFTYYSNDWHRRKIIEAVPIKGVVDRPSDSTGNIAFKPKYDIEVDITRFHYLIDVPYDYVSLIGFLWVLFWRWVRIKVRLPRNTSKRILCSEYNALVMNSGYQRLYGRPCPGMADPHWMSPQDLLVFCRQNPDLFTPVSVD